MADEGMRSGDEALGRNRHKTDTGTKKQAFSRYGKIQQRAGKNCPGALRRNGFKAIRHNNQQQAITAFC